MNGILNVYKEKGYTSHDVVAKLRRICHQKKIGHTGTLDPDAEGVLPVCLGTATKVCGLLTDQDKEYRAVLLLGKETDTQDISGRTIRESAVACTEGEAVSAVLEFVGNYSQIPPMYSALKVNGHKLCDLAREGIEVPRTPRPVKIYDIRIERMDLPRIWLRVQCSKGTYIRTLCHDIGNRLGMGGCMESLLRTQAGMFRIGESIRLSQIKELAEAGCLEGRLLGADRLFLQYPSVSVAKDWRRLLENGNRLPKHAFFATGENGQGEGTASADTLRVYLDEGEKEFFGLYHRDIQKGDYKPLKIFWQRD